MRVVVNVRLYLHKLITDSSAEANGVRHSGNQSSEPKLNKFFVS
jgi:hypothetical protein